MISTVNLCGRWEFRQAGHGAFLQAEVPGCVHSDLMANRKISDPFASDYELSLQWIEQVDWEYRREFKVSADILAQPCVELVCEGLDTVAEIRINKLRIASTDNMFTGYRFDIKKILRPGMNLIEIRFQAPMKYIRRHRHLCDCKPDNDPVGGACLIRKEQCSFGWDWGPRLATSGIYRPIRIESGPAWRLASVEVRQHHAPGKVTLNCIPRIDGRGKREKITWRSTLRLGNKIIARGNGLRLTVKNPRLWWPHGLGAQPLYTLSIEGLREGVVVDTWTRRIGLRTLILDRHRDRWGQTFQFVVNGVPVFAKGANWVPGHSFQASVTPEIFEDTLQSAVDANMNMIRVWGGGVYENDLFYDLCDEKGLLVWQDFMFACALYPGNTSFLTSVTREFEYQVQRLRHHAALALWCGNNELEIAHRNILKDPVHKKAYEEIFYRILPDVVRRLNSQCDYWPSSPHNPWGYEKGMVAGEKGGDTHDWEVWHGRKRPDHFEKTQNRFVSEFGMQSYASLETTRQFADPETANMFDNVMENHQKCPTGNSLIFHYIAQQYRFPRDFSALIYLSQVNQAVVVKTAVEHYRRSMPRTMGSLYWQLNDCWPVASWSSIEFGGRWKTLHYAARRFHAPVLVSARRIGEDLVGSINRRFNTLSGAEIHTVSDSRRPIAAELRWTLYHLNGKKLLAGSRKVRLLYGKSVLQKKLKLSKELVAHGRESVYLRLEVRDRAGILSENTVFFSALRFMELPKESPRWRIRRLGKASFQVEIRAKTFQHMVVIEVVGMKFRMSDNGFDLYPGIPRRIKLSLEKDYPQTFIRKKIRIMTMAQSY